MKSLVPPLAVVLLAATIALGRTPSLRASKARRPHKPLPARLRVKAKASTVVIVGPLPMPCLDENYQVVPCSTGGAASGGTTNAGTSAGSTNAGGANAGSTNAGGTNGGGPTGGGDTGGAPSPTSNGGSSSGSTTSEGIGGPPIITTGGGSGSAGGTSSGGTTSGAPDPTPPPSPTPPPVDPHSWPPIGTPPLSGQIIAEPYGSTFRYPPNEWGFCDGASSASFPYWNWYWYTYMGWIAPAASHGHPHPAIGTSPPSWLPIPRRSGDDYVYADQGPYITPPEFIGQHVTPADPDYAYWVWYVGAGGTTDPGPTTSGDSSGGDPIDNPPPPPITTSNQLAAYDDASWTISVNKYVLPGTRISGTNIECSFLIRVTSKWLKSAHQQVPTYKSVFLNSVQVFIGNETDPSTPINILPAPSSPPPGPWSPSWLPSDRFITFAPSNENSSLPPDYEYIPKFRFSSTHFADGEDVPVKVVLTFRGQNDGAPSAPIGVSSPTFTFKVCNKALALATKLYVSCEQGKYVKTDAPTPSQYDWDSQRAIPSEPDGTGGVDRILKMNHSLLGGQFLKKPDILSLLKDATTFFAYTHGEPDGFLPSEGVADNVASSDKLLFGSGTTSEVGMAVRAGRKNPLPNMVVMHACSTLKSGENLSRALGILFGGQTYDLSRTDRGTPDRALAAFPDVVSTEMYDVTYPQDTTLLSNPALPYLSDHAKLIYKSLLNGMTIGSAVRLANRTFHTSHATCTTGMVPMSMRVDGDPATRLVGIYTGTDTDPMRNSDGSLAWWLLLPPISATPSNAQQAQP